MTHIQEEAAKQAIGAGIGVVGGAITKHVANGPHVPLAMTAGSAFGATLVSTGSVSAALSAGTGVVTAAASAGVATASASVVAVGAAAVAAAPLVLGAAAIGGAIWGLCKLFED